MPSCLPARRPASPPACVPAYVVAGRLCVLGIGPARSPSPCAVCYAVVCRSARPRARLLVARPLALRAFVGQGILPTRPRPACVSRCVRTHLRLCQPTCSPARPLTDLPIDLLIRRLARPAFVGRVCVLWRSALAVVVCAVVLHDAAICADPTACFAQPPACSLTCSSHKSFRTVVRPSACPLARSYPALVSARPPICVVCALTVRRPCVRGGHSPCALAVGVLCAPPAPRLC
ncbi:uncharacterized protein B0H18DRAFT_72681 [Fomitopsis serialis]|uniref:uncharacterized protein n=1 Tax=Fomitopsis serialis TaxID=139415 RepID=UPI002008C524|nr:uncharacterized protein B0H18DRAFT_72681 [Neoantrodia serialis]KAH9931983.1 hypothetical protein B0H18DRAFT_72681 [Neoantrodia serialis]